MHLCVIFRTGGDFVKLTCIPLEVLDRVQSNILLSQ